MRKINNISYQRNDQINDQKLCRICRKFYLKSIRLKIPRYSNFKMLVNYILIPIYLNWRYSLNILALVSTVTLGKPMFN